RRQCPARPTPLSPEVHEYGLLARFNRLPSILLNVQDVFHQYPVSFPKSLDESVGTKGSTPIARVLLHHTERAEVRVKRHDAPAKIRVRWLPAPHPSEHLHFFRRPRSNRDFCCGLGRTGRAVRQRK